MEKMYILTTRLLYESGHTVLVPETFDIYTEAEKEEKTKRIMNDTGLTDITELCYEWHEVNPYKDSLEYSRDFVSDKIRERAI